VTLRIEREIDDGTLTIRLIGRIQTEHLGALKAELQNSPNSIIAIDLAEVTNLDVDSVRFLSRHEQEGVKLLNCPLFIREWIRVNNDGTK
jgi:anti-anti-sigma regulatory factor